MVRTYGVKPDELLAWQRILPADRDMFLILLNYRSNFGAALKEFHILEKQGWCRGR